MTDEEPVGTTGGEILIGLVIGPYGLARLADDFPWLSYLLITDVAGVRALAELGVIFLLFMIGLELSFERLWGMRRLVFGMGTAQIVTTAIVIGAIAFVWAIIVVSPPSVVLLHDHVIEDLTRDWLPRTGVNQD